MWKMFESEDDLLYTLDKYDQLIEDCVFGNISFQEFLKNTTRFETK